MAREFSLRTQGATGSSANTFKTMLAIICANTAGHRGELRWISIGGGGGAPQDYQARLRINRTSNAGAGTPGSSPTPAKMDPNSLASILTAGDLYSAEPTTYETVPLYEVGFNSRGGHSFSWPVGRGIKFGINQTLGILVAPSEAAAINLCVSIGYVEW